MPVRHGAGSSPPPRWPRSWWSAASATSRSEGTTAPRRARAPRSPRRPAHRRRFRQRHRRSRKRRIGLTASARELGAPRPTAPRGAARDARRLRRSPGRREPRPPPSLHRQLGVRARTPARPGERRRVARHALRALACAGELPDGTIVAIGTGHFGARDAIVVETSLPDGTTSLDAVVAHPCEVRPLD